MGADRLEVQGQVAAAQFAVPFGVGEADRRELLEDHRHVVEFEAESHRAGLAGAFEHATGQRIGVGGELEQLGRRGERARELDREGVDVGVDDPGDELVEAVIGIDAVVEGGLGDLDEPLQPVGAERLQQLVLAGVAAIQRAQADAGALRDRLPADLRAAPRGPDLGAVPMTSLYLTEDEWAAEMANRTVHSVMHVGWVPDGTGGYRGQMAVLVKPNGLFGAAYMAAIKPFRHLIVYPALMRAIERDWQTD